MGDLLNICVIVLLEFVQINSFTEMIRTTPLAIPWFSCWT